MSIDLDEWGEVSFAVETQSKGRFQQGSVMKIRWVSREVPLFFSATEKSHPTLRTGSREFVVLCVPYNIVRCLLVQYNTILPCVGVLFMLHYTIWLGWYNLISVQYHIILYEYIIPYSGLTGPNAEIFLQR